MFGFSIKLLIIPTVYVRIGLMLHKHLNDTMDLLRCIGSTSFSTLCFDSCSLSSIGVMETLHYIVPFQISLGFQVHTSLDA